MTATRRGSRLGGLLALLALLLLVFGVPAALLAVAGNPLHPDLPAWRDLLSPDDGSLFLTVLVLVGWLAWASFAGSVLLETLAALRGAQAPRLPALHVQQRTAATLVAAVAALFSLGGPAMASTAPALAATVAVQPASQPLQQPTPAADAAQQLATQPAASSPAPAPRDHLVTNGESLWSIAEDELGDGARYTEIAQLNYGAPQPDGRTLGTNHWLQPGWTLKVPAATTTAGGGAAGAPAAEPQHTRTVQSGDTLSEIAQDELGQASRFPEIAAASRNVVQPDGAHLTDPDLLRPGWTVVIPGSQLAAPAVPEAAVPTPPPASAPPSPPAAAAPTQPATPEPPTPAPADERGQVDEDLPVEDQTGEAQADEHLLEQDQTEQDQTGQDQTSEAQADEDLPDQDQAEEQVAPTPTPTSQPGLVVPGQAGPSSAPTASPAPTGPTAAATDHAEQPGPADDGQSLDEQTDQQVDDDQGVDVRTVSGVGALLCAGVIALIAARRRRQQEDRHPGAELPLPSGASADVEQELRATADPLTVETVDLALRTLAHRCAQAHQPLPAVRAARLTDGQFDLYLAEPAALPAPWSGTTDATVWTLPADADELLDPATAAGVPAPYPSLVTIGHDEEDGHVLLDLEHLGALAVTGDQTTTRGILTALAVELATSRWADDLQVTLVGAGPELEDILRSGRIRYQPAIGRVLDDLARRANTDRASLAEQGVSSLQQARAAGVSPDAWTPEIVLLAGEVTDSQRQQLQDLVEQLPRVAIAAVTTGQPVGEWALCLDGQDTAVLEPIGLQIRPQLLDDATCAGLLDVLSIADEPATSALPAEPEPALVDLPPAPQTEQTEQDHHLLLDLTATPAAATRTAEHSPTRTTPATAGPTTTATATGSIRIHLVDTDDSHAPTADADAHEARVPASPGAVAVAADSQDAPAGDPTATTISASASSDAGAARPSSPAVLDEGDGVRTTGTAAAVAAGDLPHPAPASTDTSAPDSAGLTDPAVTDGPTHELGTRPAPRLLLLGRPELVQTHGPLPQSSQAKRYTELAALLALHPGLTTIRVRDLYFAGRDAQGRAPKSTTEALSRLRRWLGDDAYLPRNPKEGRYVFGADVTSDWQDFRDLLPSGARGATSDALEQALALVRGRPLPEVNPDSGVIPKQYSWAEHEVQRMRSAIVDAAHELARRRLMEGRYQAALDAVARGLLAEPGVERLWRLRIMAAHAGGDQTLAQDAVTELLDINDRHGRDLEPATSELLEQLRNPTAGHVAQLAPQAL